MRSRMALAVCVLVVGAGGVTLALAQDESDQPPMPTLPEGVKDADDLPDEDREAYEEGMLESLAPAPDEDGDPSTLEGVLPDGREGTIIIQTSEPEKYEGMTVDDFEDEASE